MQSTQVSNVYYLYKGLFTKATPGLATLGILVGETARISLRPGMSVLHPEASIFDAPPRASITTDEVTRDNRFGW